MQKEFNAFTPLEITTDFSRWLSSYRADDGIKPPSAQTVRERSSLTGFTLIELLIIIIIIGILATLSLPQFGKTKEHAIGKEATANLKLIAAAEKIYRMETGIYYASPIVEPQGHILDTNTNLKLSLDAGTSRNWDYSITADASSFTAHGDRTTGSYPNCIYGIDNTTDEPTPVVPANCP